jgi:hypothetical protein
MDRNGNSVAGGDRVAVERYQNPLENLASAQAIGGSKGLNR